MAGNQIIHGDNLPAQIAVRFSVGHAVWWLCTVFFHRSAGIATSHAVASTVSLSRRMPAQTKAPCWRDFQIALLSKTGPHLDGNRLSQGCKNPTKSLQRVIRRNTRTYGVRRGV